jgi:hypothetical protein
MYMQILLQHYKAFNTLFSIRQEEGGRRYQIPTLGASIIT